MTLTLNETHDPDLTSWVDSANQPGCDFPLQNLPFSVFRRKDGDELFRGGVAIGNKILDLGKLSGRNLFTVEVDKLINVCAGPSLNHFMQLGSESWSLLRLHLSRALRSDSDIHFFLSDCLVEMDQVEFNLPCEIGDYTDFYTSIHHATNVGSLFRPDNPLLPNYKWLPIGYHGRASSIQVSPQNLRRPMGQLKEAGAEFPAFAASRRLDYELELGIFIGSGNKLSEPILIDEADQHVFGFCVFNDWSARDIQAWEYVPLGPFLSKSFASTISPWIVTSEALLPFRKEFSRDEQDPLLMDYLYSEKNEAHGAIDIKLQVSLQTQQMRDNNEAETKLAETTFANSYWSVAQMVAHHTVNGCNLNPGDFFGSGTQSGSGETELGSMLELCRGGQQTITLPDGEQRSFLQDGDRVVMTAYCEQDGATRIGFGSAIGTVLPAISTV